jgi:hypothetical protein
MRVNKAFAVLIVCLISFGSLNSTEATESKEDLAKRFPVYNLTIRLILDEHRLEATGTITLPAESVERGTIQFSLRTDMKMPRVKVLEPEGSAGAVRYTQSPTQPLSYLMGMMMIQELRKEYQRVKGDQFQIGEFHDALLDYGSIPVKVIRDSMLGKE